MRFETEKIKNLPVDSIGEIPKGKEFLKLNSNENPFSLPFRVKLAVYRELKNANLYPDQNCTALKEKLASKFNMEFNLNLDADNIFVANGSDEVIAFLTQAFFENCDKPLIFPSITYCIDVWAELYSAKYECIPNKTNFEIDIDALCREDCSGVYIANPNTTGLALSLNEVEKLVNFHHKKRLVVIDEAYIDFGGESAVGLVEKYENLLITRTFSKSYSLAGLRLGYAVANKDIIHALSALKDAFGIVGVNRLSLKAGEAVLSCEKQIKSRIEKINNAKKLFLERLKNDNYLIIPSSTNFVWINFDGKNATAKEYYEKLKEHGVFVRYFGSGWNKNWIRITIGSIKQMNKVYTAIQKCSLSFEK